jgi:Flp pilus assembly protein TadD
VTILPRSVALAALAALLSACAGGELATPTGSGLMPSDGGGFATSASDPERKREFFLAVVSGLRRESKSRAALGFLDDYDKIYPGDPRAALLRADCLVDIGDLDGATKIYTALAETPQAAGAAAGLGAIAGARGDWQGAVTELKRAVALEPTNVRFVNNLGFAQMQAGDLESAEYELRKAAEIDPRNVGVRNNLIILLLRAGKRDEAQRMLAQLSPAERAQIEKMTASSGARRAPARTGR